MEKIITHKGQTFISCGTIANFTLQTKFLTVKILNFQILQSQNIIAIPYKILKVKAVSCIIHIIMSQVQQSINYAHHLPVGCPVYC